MCACVCTCESPCGALCHADGALCVFSACMQTVLGVWCMHMDGAPCTFGACMQTALRACSGLCKQTGLCAFFVRVCRFGCVNTRRTADTCADVPCACVQMALCACLCMLGCLRVHRQHSVHAVWMWACLCSCVLEAAKVLGVPRAVCMGGAGQQGWCACSDTSAAFLVHTELPVAVSSSTTRSHAGIERHGVCTAKSRRNRSQLSCIAKGKVGLSTATFLLLAQPGTDNCSAKILGDQL